MDAESYENQETADEIVGARATPARRELTMAILVAVLAMGAIVTALLLATAMLPPR